MKTFNELSGVYLSTLRTSEISMIILWITVCLGNSVKLSLLTGNILLVLRKEIPVLVFSKNSTVKSHLFSMTNSLTVLSYGCHKINDVISLVLANCKRFFCVGTE